MGLEGASQLEDEQPHPWVPATGGDGWEVQIPGGPETKSRNQESEPVVACHCPRAG